MFILRALAAIVGVFSGYMAIVFVLLMIKFDKSQEEMIGSTFIVLFLGVIAYLMFRIINVL